MTPPSNEDARWFAEEVLPHGGQLKAYLRGSFPTVRDVDDLVQESYLRVWKRQLARPISRVSGSVSASVKGFLFQVARRLAFDALRRERSSPIQGDTNAAAALLEATPQEPGVAETVCSEQEFQMLLEAVDALPPRCRAVVILRKLQGASTRETARQLGISEETVHVHARRGLQRLQDWLRDRGAFEGNEP